MTSRIVPATRIGEFPSVPSYNIRFGSLRAPCSAPNGITGRVSDWIDSVQLSDIPSAVQTRVKHLILDGIACIIVGAKLPWSRVAVQGVLNIEGPGKCTLFGWNKVRTTFNFPSVQSLSRFLLPCTDGSQRLSPLNAALLNGSFIQGFELDDVHVDAPWHANSVILPALFAAAEHAQSSDASKIDGETFLTSTVTGFELGSRIGRALHGHEMLSRGWHSVSFPPRKFGWVTNC